MTSSGRATRMPGPDAWLLAGACMAVGMGAWVAVPGGGIGHDTPSTPIADPTEDPAPPRTRSIKAPELPREGPGVGVGGLSHRALPRDSDRQDR